MKFTKRLDYSRLAQALAERDLVDLAAIQELLQASNEGGQPFAEALVTSNLVSDWDLSRIVAEVFHLPFVPVDHVKPDEKLLELFHSQLLHNTGLVPVSKYGNVLTMAMPGIVQADTLALLSAETNLVILPIVGTVNTNRKWLGENCKVETFQQDDSWGSLFDEGDAAVQSTLSGDEVASSEAFSMDDIDENTLSSLEESDGVMETAIAGDLDLETASLDFDEADSDIMSQLDVLDEVPSLAESADLDIEDMEESLQFDVAQTESKDDDDSDELPPMPDFNA